MEVSYILLLYFLITIFLIFYKYKTLDTFENTCKFIPKGNTKKECVLNCTKTNSCDPDKCYNICEKCQDHKMCEWLVPPSCTFTPEGSNLHTCIDTCIGPRKIKWGDKACIYPECKRICNECKDTEKCAWTKKTEPVKECKFVPWGPTKQSCIDRCSSDDKETWGGDACTPEKCDNICKSCKKDSYCKWKAKESPFHISNKLGIPPKQEFRVIPSNSTLIVQWSPNHSKDAKNIGYMISYFLSDMPQSGIKVKYIDDTGCNFCQHTLNNLENYKNYSVGIIALNKFGKSGLSEVVESMPKSNINIK